MVTAITFSRPNCCSNGARASTKPMAEQLGLVTTNPPLWRRHDWHSNTLRCPALTSGITRGTSFCMRRALELVMTACPAAAKRGSSSAAMEASRAAKTILGAPSGLAAETGSSATLGGMGVLSRQRTASAYRLPSERSEAASHPTSNQGWRSSICRKRWPTIPVAPSTLTGTLLGCMDVCFGFYTTRRLALYREGQHCLRQGREVPHARTSPKPLHQRMGDYRHRAGQAPQGHGGAARAAQSAQL